MDAFQEEFSLRESLPGDEPELKKLWQAVFGDSMEYISFFFDTLYSPGLACLALRQGELACAGYCIPGALAKGKNCSYIYAVATYPEHRGKGAAALVVRRLAERAFECGAQIVATLPAKESLGDWYSKVLGMEPTFLKGAKGVEFSAEWLRFAEYYGRLTGEEKSDSPDRLWALASPGLDLEDFRDCGWEFTFE